MDIKHSYISQSLSTPLGLHALSFLFLALSASSLDINVLDLYTVNYHNPVPWVALVSRCAPLHVRARRSVTFSCTIGTSNRAQSPV